ncbi:MAG: histidinol dehydrogenase [Promethearchaeota archaeon]
MKIFNSELISEENISKFIFRTTDQLNDIKSDVLRIINDVKDNGDKAIVKLTKELDKVDTDICGIKVSEEEINEAYNNINKSLLEALRYAKGNLIKFHNAQKREPWSIEIEKGVKVSQIYRPLESIGIYIPGGRAIYPSTVLMAATPAHVAGVKNIILCSPPQKNKTISPEILVASKEYGIDKIYKVGGAQAIAAMAYGTETIPKVQKVIGPGNKWVNAAKQLLSDKIAIDTPAGPSEIVIIADKYANFNYVISDLLSQIEHDPENMGIIISDSNELIKRINKNLESSIKEINRKEIVKSALNNCMMIKAKDIEDCVRVANIIAPEHLEILTQAPKEVLEKINNAGAIFLGPFSPVSLGDYNAGINHILPTGGNAKKYSGLNVYDFYKIIGVLECNDEGLRKLSDSATIIAEYEGLCAHKRSIEERLKEKN